ncbi:hypothetical protein Patl1_00330 [Pistacia atlantica]|uniref:Uncharacterized protein n=1 Tax=Pistacia atlantica TaxID=434234 RepID=A0ACC1CDC3_9ROSI|nr:hypothetical protein Patl1_00330 [Pistacia atlantica]
MDQVLSVYPNRYHKLHTTKSWDFIGLPQTAGRNLEVESNIIVGLLDSGITPESESFKDTGFGPPPTKWKGSCKQYANFSGCNKDDRNDILSPVDVQGHGTHTSSTAVGNHIANASLYGLANGTARGAVPNARVAAYKVCWVSLGCSDVDILAGFNAAIHDGVDVISISIGGGKADYSSDSIAIGSFHALKEGIITVASAGNGGPDLASLDNHAPWLVTVAASGINRQFRSKVDLGDGKTVSGIGVDAFEPKQKLYPLVNGVDVAKNDTEKSSARFCFANSLDPTKVKGKLVFCQQLIRGADSVVKGIGGVGTIVESDRYLDTAQIFMAPGTMVNHSDGNIITSYINSTREPLAVIYKSKELEIPAPFIASFSSRGPNPGSKRILKPDIAAPGVDILASYTPLKSLTGLEGDTQFSKFSIISGTSMACPHVAGVAAYVKSFHPSWSPSAIKSAILTSATPMNRRMDRLAEFSYGAGQVNPQEAVSPGLIYDADQMSYIQFLCHEGYTGSSLAVIVGSKSVNCSSLIPGLGHDALNYPTMHVKLDINYPTTAIFQRTVTNVGDPVSIYNATILAPKGVNISVKPKSLSFSRSMQKRSFTVVVKASPKPIPESIEMLSGFLAASGEEQSNLYVVYLGDMVNKDSLHLEDDDSMIDQSHIQILASVKLSLRPLSTSDVVENEAKESIHYSYTKSFNAFAAKLSTDEVEKLMEMDQVLSVYQNRYHKLHTTKSWDFIGLPLTAKRNLKVESNIIVGLLDTGITPESESFKDTGFGPPPTKWKEVVNTMLISQDATNVEGHGTHTSSTAVGNHIANASLYGLAKGTARGAVPNARVAAYKVCWVGSGCSDVDILAGFNAAIHDGVDVISISIGGANENYSSDSIAIGSFHALKKGIITVASAGNYGPSLASLNNHAPWLVTVAASGINRQFRSKVELGNGKNVSGIGFSAFEPKQKLYPLVNGADVAKNDGERESARFCISDSLDPKKVKGKFVYCQLEIWGVDSVVKGIGGVGTIVEIIYKSQELEVPAPFIASFSSRGPNPGSERILKPDIAAPGVSILASYTPLKSLTGLEGDTQFSKFSIMSGTSMACPHVAGVAAYVKSFHPSWSPAAIKSAILTSATPMSRRMDRFAEFSYGAGQVNPHKAASPGLIYEIDQMGYIQFLCHEGYTGSSLGVLVGSKSINCSSLVPGFGYDALNYPTMQVKLNGDKQSTTAIFHRTVTNVGAPVSIYNATIKAPRGVEISVKPMSLSFSRSMEKQSFTVVVKANPMPASTQLLSGSLVWKSPRHVVRSPIVLYQAQESDFIKHY